MPTARRYSGHQHDYLMKVSAEEAIKIAIAAELHRNYRGLAWQINHRRMVEAEIRPEWTRPMYVIYLYGKEADAFVPWRMTRRSDKAAENKAIAVIQKLEYKTRTLYYLPHIVTWPRHQWSRIKPWIVRIVWW